MTEEIIVFVTNCVKKVDIQMKQTEIESDENRKKVKDAFQIVN